MILELLKPILEWSGLGIVPLLLLAILLVKIFKD